MKAPTNKAGSVALAWIIAIASAAADEPAQKPPQETVQRDLIRMRQSPEEEPWLRINAGGHVAAVQALAFTPDSKRLCSAGLDKVVQVWNLAAVTRDLRRTFLRERVIRWQVARGLRGSIYALAAAPSDGLLALGGYGAMGSLGEILLVDPVQGTLAKVLQGHRQTICSLAFSADGKHLASSDVAGQVMLWNRNAWQPITLYDVDAKTYGDALAAVIQSQPKIRPIAIAGATHVIVPACVGKLQDGRLGWQLQQINIADTRDFHTLDGALHVGLVTALAASADGALLASADMDGKLYLWDLKRSAGGRPGPLAGQLAPRGVVVSLAFDPQAKTLVCGTAAAADGTSQFQVWDLAAKSMRRSRRFSDHVRACAVSPDGQRVAYTGGNDHEVFVEPLAGGESATALRGTGRRLLKVAFAKDEPCYRFAVGTEFRDRGFNDYAEVQESFDPLRLELGGSPAKAPDWLAADWCQGDWTAQLQADGGLQLFRSGTPQGRVRLDPLLEGKARSYCWIPGPAGAPAAIAVGTDVQNGIYVYRLAAEGDCPLLRHFRGHSDYVTSVGVSRDGRYLVSCSADGSVMLWSLALLEQGGAVVGRWGAELAVQAAGLVAQTVHPAGPLFGKGLRSGDALTEIRWSDGRAVRSEGRPADMLQQLQSLPWMTQVTFDYRRAGSGRPPFQLLPAWPPLATLFANSHRDWAFWTPQGYYEVSADGDSLFGWQVNRGLHALPDFYRADQFRKKLERPDVLERLLSAGSLDGAFRQAAAAPPVEPQRVVPQQIAVTPQIEILTPLFGSTVAGDVARVRAQIIVPAPAKLLQAKVYANGVVATRPKLVSQRDVDRGRLLTYDWEVPLTSDEKNLIELVAGTDAQTTAFREVLVERRSILPPTRLPKLYILALGINRYADPAIQPLSFAVADAAAVLQVLQQRCRGLYDVGRAVLLSEGSATPEAWRGRLDEIAAAIRGHAKPDDLLVLFFAGHGVLDAESGVYYFVGHDFKIADLLERRYAGCISWQDFHSLADIPCRKLVLLDSCHSGAIQPLRSRNLKAAIRTLEDDVIFTLTASTGNQRSAENKLWQHGVFTKCLIDGLGGQAAAAADRFITLNELAGYVERSVPRLTEGMQNPVAAPDQILPFTSLRLAARP
jgi:WD40 repeat protein